MKKWFLLVSFTLLHLNAWSSSCSKCDCRLNPAESDVARYTRLVAVASQPGSSAAPLLSAYLAKLHHFENLEEKNAGLGSTTGAARAAYAATRTSDCYCSCHTTSCYTGCDTMCH